MKSLQDSLLVAALLACGAQHATAQDPTLAFELVEATAAVTTESQVGSATPSLRERYFPTPASGLTLAAGELTIESLLEQFSAVTGETVVWSMDTEALIRMTKLPLRGELQIAPEDVYSVVQDLLGASRFVISSLRREEPRILKVASLDSPARASIRGGALYLPFSDVSDFAQDSAMLFQAVVPMPHSNLREFENSLRQLVVDPNLTQLVPFRELHQVVITASGRRLAYFVEVLQAIDDGVRRRAEGEAQLRSTPSRTGFRNRYFPAPDAALTVGADVQSVAQLLEEFTAVTDEHVLWSLNTAALLQYPSNLGNGGDVRVAPDEVRSFVQSALVSNRFVMTTLRRKAPRLSFVVSLDSPARATIRQDALFVPQAEVRPFGADAATMITTVVSLEHVDSIGSALRHLVVDPNTLQIVPLDTTGQVIVTGLGFEAVRTVELLEALDMEHGLQSEARRAAEEAAKANEPAEAGDASEAE